MAVAMASKLVKAWTITNGESAAIQAAQIRRRAVSAVAQMVTNQKRASPRAARSKNSTTSRDAGTPHFSCADSHARATDAMPYMYMPVMTGYSMYRLICSPSGPSSYQKV